MKPSIRALYLQGGRVGGVEIEGQVWQLDGVAFRWSCRAPEELEGLDVYDLIVIDGEGLSGGVVPLASRQLPWPVDDNYLGRWKRGMRGLAFRG